MQRALRSSVYWFAPHDLLSLLSYRSGANSPGMASPAMVWALSCLSLIKKMSYLLEYSPSYGGGFFFFNSGSLLSDDYRLCQVDVKVASKVSL